MFLSIIQDWAHNQHPEENKKEQKHPELAAVCCTDSDTTHYLSQALVQGTEQRSFV